MTEEILRPAEENIGSNDDPTANIEENEKSDSENTPEDQD